jgi:poly-beta-1,6-N-acetyl-D-glucosamine synthase
MWQHKHDRLPCLLLIAYFQLHMTFYLLLFAIYFALVLLLITGWQIALEKPEEKSVTGTYNKISVIVPFRNEEDNLPKLLDGLLSQSYSKDSYEVILVDDHSTDRSNLLVSSFCAGNPNFKLLHLGTDQQGKKRALTLAIEAATGEIIVTTDADCTVPKDWLAKINSSFQDDKTMMAIGAVKIDPDPSFFSHLQAMEFSSLIGSSAATLSYGVPTMCNGANLAFRKAAFVEVGGYEGNLDIASGDDEFLMRKISKRFSKAISFIPESDSVVSTLAHQTLNGFVNQRVRWAGKWKYSQSISGKVLAIFIFVFQFSYLSLFLVLVGGWIPLKVGGLLVVIKFVLEFLFLYNIGVFLRSRWRWLPFFCLQFIYPVYVLWIAFGTEMRGFEWKGRKGR